MGMAEGSNVMSDLANEKTDDEMMLEPEISDESLEAAAGGNRAYTYLFLGQGVEVRRCPHCS